MLDASEIEDAVSQASLRVWKSRQRLDLGRGTLRAWFYVISRNCALRMLEVKRGPQGLSLLANLDRHPSPVGEPADEGAVLEDATMGRTKLASDLHACIARLPARQRTIMLADLAAGGTAETQRLVQELSTSVGAIHVARTTARKSLRLCLLGKGYLERGAVNGAGSGSGK